MNNFMFYSPTCFVFGKVSPTAVKTVCPAPGQAVFAFRRKPLVLFRSSCAVPAFYSFVFRDPQYFRHSMVISSNCSALSAKRFTAS